jgi:glucokinase
VAILVGVDVGGTKTAVVAGTVREDGLEILSRVVFPTEPRTNHWRETVRRVVEEARGLVRRHSPSERPAAVGVSCGGPLDSRAGLVQSPPGLPGWDEVPVVREFGQALGCRAFLQNDANACALAEWRYGAGRGTRNMMFLTFGTGMGSGLIIDGSLYEGTNDLAGEIGHWRIAEDGPVGYGKPGAFEAFCSGSGLPKMARIAAEKAWAQGRTVGFIPDRQALERVTARTIGEAAEAGDPFAVELMAECGRILGRGLALMIDIINPQRIVIGSIYVRCRRFLQPTMEAEIAREALPAAARVCQVVPAALGESIGDYACLSVAADGLARERT